MVLLLYTLTFIASLSVTAGLLLAHRRIITSVVMLSFLVTLNSFGRLLIGVASTMELANLGNMLLQLGACFCPLLLIYILADSCEVKLPSSLKTGLLILALVVLCLPLPIPGFHLFYESLTLGHESNFSYLIKVFGPLHVLYPAMLVTYVVVCICIMVMALRKNLKAHAAMVVSTVIIMLIIMAFYLVDRITNNNINYSTHGYFLAMLLLMWRMERANMYDLSSNISKSIEAMDENGYIQFDRCYRCTGVNKRARKLFPEIDSTWHIGRKIPVSDSYLYQEVILWVYNRKKGEKKTIQTGDQYYELIVRDIPYRKQACVGYLLALVNRTNENHYLAAMDDYRKTLERDVEKKTEHIAHIRDHLVLGMASMIESRDDSTGNHIKRTYAIMQVFADHLRNYKEELGITDEFLDMVTRAAPMHDLGKIAIDDAVLKKQGLFTAEDFDLMKVHPAEGAKIVREILTGAEDERFVTIAVNVAHYHHEKWDGTGYPKGLKGEEIPLEARIMALPDVFDALASKRRYKDALPYDVVFPMIEHSLGSHFDPKLGRLFIECRPALEEMYRKWYEEDMDNASLQLTPPRKKQVTETN